MIEKTQWQADHQCSPLSPLSLSSKWKSRTQAGNLTSQCRHHPPALLVPQERCVCSDAGAFRQSDLIFRDGFRAFRELLWALFRRPSDNSHASDRLPAAGTIRSGVGGGRSVAVPRRFPKFWIIIGRLTKIQSSSSVHVLQHERINTEEGNGQAQIKKINGASH